MTEDGDFSAVDDLCADVSGDEKVLNFESPRIHCFKNSANFVWVPNAESFIMPPPGIDQAEPCRSFFDALFEHNIINQEERKAADSDALGPRSIGQLRIVRERLSLLQDVWLTRTVLNGLCEILDSSEFASQEYLVMMSSSCLELLALANSFKLMVG